MINGKNLEHRPISDLMTIVRRDLKKLNAMGLIDEGSCVKTIMSCNATLGIPIREIRQICIPIDDYKGQLPLDFEKLYYACFHADTKLLVYNMRNPFDNKVDADAIYEARVQSGYFEGKEKVTINIARRHDLLINDLENDRFQDVTVSEMTSWKGLDVAKISEKHCFPGCPIVKHKGRPTLIINDDNTIEVSIKKGVLYVMYVANMKDSEGRLLFPFHEKITPWYEWAVKEKVIMDAIFNLEGQEFAGLLKIAKQERGLAWIDAFNATTDKALGAHSKSERQKELKWYNQYFKYFL